MNTELLILQAFVVLSMEVQKFCRYQPADLHNIPLKQRDISIPILKLAV